MDQLFLWLTQSVLFIVFLAPLYAFGYTWSLRGTPGIWERFACAMGVWLAQILLLLLMGLSAFGCVGGCGASASGEYVVLGGLLVLSAMIVWIVHKM